MVYEAKVVRGDTNKPEFYTGVTVGPFKQRYYGHNFDFRHRSQRTSTCLSKYVWELKDQGIDYTLTWKIIARGRGFNPTTRSCQACLKEKFYIMFRPEGATLNNRNEFYNTCRHRKTLLLENTWATNFVLVQNYSLTGCVPIHFFVIADDCGICPIWNKFKCLASDLWISIVTNK